MAITIKSKITNPQAVELTLWITMTIPEWEQTVADLAPGAWKLRDAISRVITGSRAVLDEQILHSDK